MPFAFDFLKDRKKPGWALWEVFWPFLRQIQPCPPMLDVDNEHQRAHPGVMTAVS
jgi:hypothetical protein